MHRQAIRKFEWDPSNIRWVKKFINLFSGLKKGQRYKAWCSDDGVLHHEKCAPPPAKKEREERLKQ